MNSAVIYRSYTVQQLVFAFGLLVILLTNFALANDLAYTPKSKKTFHKTVNNSLESQWRTPLSNQNDWRESPKTRKGVKRTFDNYDPDDLDKFRNSPSYSNQLQDQNPTLFGLKLKF
jgi:hypothetical protein